MAQQPRFVAQSMPGQISAYSAAVAALANGSEVRECIGALAIGHLDPMGRPCNVRSRTTVRLDRQPNAGSGEHVCANLQVQVNAAAGVPPGQGTTIGQVLVPALVYAVANQPGPARESLRSQLLNVVRSALNRSVAGRGAWFTIGIQP